MLLLTTPVLYSIFDDVQGRFSGGKPARVEDENGIAEAVTT